MARFRKSLSSQGNSPCERKDNTFCNEIQAFLSFDCMFFTMPEIRLRPGSAKPELYTLAIMKKGTSLFRCWSHPNPALHGTQGSPGMWGSPAAALSRKDLHTVHSTPNLLLTRGSRRSSKHTKSSDSATSCSMFSYLQL